MLITNKSKDKESVGLALRVSAKSAFGAKASHKLLPSEIINKHWEIACSADMVAYSTNVPLDPKKSDEIEKVFLFANSKEEMFICRCDVVEILIGDKEWIPNIDAKYLVPEWENEAKKNWLILKNFKQIDIDTCEYQLLNENIYLKEQMLKPRFNTCYVSLKDK